MQGDQSTLRINDKSELLQIDQNEDELIITSQDMINMEIDEKEEQAALDETTFKHLYDKFDLSQENVKSNMSLRYAFNSGQL